MPVEFIPSGMPAVDAGLKYGELSAFSISTLNSADHAAVDLHALHGAEVESNQARPVDHEAAHAAVADSSATSRCSPARSPARGSGRSGAPSAP